MNMGTFEIVAVCLLALVYLVVNTGVCYVMRYWFDAD